MVEEAHHDEETLPQDAIAVVTFIGWSAKMQTPVTERVAVERTSYSFGSTSADSDLPFSYSSVVQPAGQHGTNPGQQLAVLEAMLMKRILGVRTTGELAHKLANGWQLHTSAVLLELMTDLLHLIFLQWNSVIDGGGW
eukprot:1888555-Rhodomonas_salina.3